MTPFFLFLSFLNSFGDSVFLTGIPIFLFSQSGGKLTPSLAVSLAINIGILIGRKWIIAGSKIHPLKLVGYGELAMAAVELFIFAIFIYLKEPWVVVLSVVPLGLIYNTYAGAKFYKIQSYLFRHNKQAVIWQSAIYRLGYIVGIAGGGIIASRYGLAGIVAIDSATFVFLGVSLLLLWRSSDLQLTPAETAPHKQINPTAELPKKGAPYGLWLISLSTLFYSWEQSAGIATASKAYSLSLEITSTIRSLAAGAAVIVILGLAKFWPNHEIKFWKFSQVATLLLIPLLGLWYSGTALLYVFFFFGGIVAALNIPIHRTIYQLYEYAGTDSVVEKHWIANSLLKLTLIALGFTADYLGSSSHSLLWLTTLSILCLGTLGGLGIEHFFTKGRRT